VKPDEGVTVTAMVVEAVTVPEVPVTVMVADPVADEVAATVTVVPLTVAVTPELELEAARVTVPMKPPTSVTVIVSLALPPCATDSDVGEAASVKPDAGVTVTAMVVEAVTVPEVPVTVMVAVPVAVEVAATVTVVPLTVAVTPELELEAVRVTVPVKPPASVTVMASVAVPPWAIDREVAEGESVKLPPDPGTITVIGTDFVIVPLVPTMLIG